jgi:hypothetical protein
VTEIHLIRGYEYEGAAVAHDEILKELASGLLNCNFPTPVNDN